MPNVIDMNPKEDPPAKKKQDRAVEQNQKISKREAMNQKIEKKQQKV